MAVLKKALILVWAVSGAAYAQDIEIVYSSRPPSALTYERRRVEVDIAKTLEGAYINNQGDVVHNGVIYKSSEVVKTFLQGPIETVPYQIQWMGPVDFSTKNARNQWVRKVSTTTEWGIREDGVVITRPIK